MAWHGMASRMHDVHIEWSAKIGLSPLRRCSFVLLQKNRICFFGNVPNNLARETA
jgi:hypothetical protein